VFTGISQYQLGDFCFGTWYQSVGTGEQCIGFHFNGNRWKISILSKKRYINSKDFLLS
jgi:hypothetical protein